MQKPSIAELLSAWGYATYTPELIQRAMSTLYGHVGANLDGRNWAAILQSANPLEAAEAALLAMYQNSAYLVSNIEHLAQKGYVPAQAELTYRQLAERVGFTHNNGWSVGTAYDGLSQKSTPQLLAEVPPPAPKTFTVTNNAGTLAFGGTATGDITFTVAADRHGHVGARRGDGCDDRGRCRHYRCRRHHQAGRQRHWPEHGQGGCDDCDHRV